MQAAENNQNKACDSKMRLRFQRLQAQPFAQRIAFEADVLTVVSEVAAAAKLVHPMGDNFAGGADVLSEEFVGKGNQFDRATFCRGAKAFGEADEAAGEAARDFIDREALDASAEI